MFLAIEPLRIFWAAGIGAVIGYGLHKESIEAWQQLRQRNAYRDRLLYQYHRDHPDSEREGEVGERGRE